MYYSGTSTSPPASLTSGYFNVQPNLWSSGIGAINFSNNSINGVNPRDYLTGFTIPFTLQLISITDPTDYLIVEVTSVGVPGLNNYFGVVCSVLSIGGTPTINDRFCINATQNGTNSECQMRYKFNSNQNVSNGITSEYIKMSTGGFTLNPTNPTFIGISFTGYSSNDFRNYLSGITSAYFFITKKEDPEYYAAFQGNLYTQNTSQPLGSSIFKIINNTFSSSDPNGSGSPSNNDILCIDIDPLTSVNSTGTTVCNNISGISINFTSVTVGDQITFTLASDLGLIAGDIIRIVYQPDPNVQVIGVIDSYDPDGASPNITITVELVVNDGYNAGTVDQSVTCYETVNNFSEFTFQRTLFVDPNGDDNVASSVTPYGGQLNPTFQTIQGAVDYIEDHYTDGDVTIHVFAGLYNVSANNPIRVGFTAGTASFVNVNLYLEDGVIIKDNSLIVSTDPNNPDYLFIMAGGRPTISGYGTISATAGPAGSLHYCNVILLRHTELARIQVERIDANFRYNVGYVFYVPVGSDKQISTFFDGEVKINDLNHGLLRMSGGTETKLFEFNHESNITILKNQNNSGYEPVVLSGQSVAIVRGDWYYQPNDVTDDRTIFNYGSTGSTYVFDGVDIYVTSGSVNNYIINTNGLTNCRMEVRERSTTNGYINPTDSIINYSFGVLEQGVPITPNKL